MGVYSVYLSNLIRTNGGMSKWLVVKGIAGLGDRLMTLGAAIEVARASGRSLVVDWRDSEWDPKGGFERWFRLEVPDVTVVAELPAVTDGMSVWPAAFQGRVGRTDLVLASDRWQVLLDGMPVRTPSSKLLERTEDVVVFVDYCSGKLSSVIPYLKWLEEIEVPIYEVAIHYRNSDKRNGIGPFLAKLTELEPSTAWLATDDPDAGRKFREALPFPIEGGVVERGIPAMMRDLWILVRAKRLVGSRNSLFTRVARVLRGDLKA